MIERHATPEEMEAYALGIEDAALTTAIEAHLGACGACQEELRRQASVDDALAELAARADFCPACDRLSVDRARCTACGAALSAGGYRVEAVMVQNAHGRIYLARDAEGRKVALKEIAFVHAPDPGAVESFERESRVLAQLRHPRIPSFLGSFREGEGKDLRLYLAQELVEGESLLGALARGSVSEADAVDIARQVLGILEYLQGLAPMVFHRDVKPTNLIRRPDGTIVLVDFGAARDLGPTVGATLVGTFGYMPVEQLGGIVDATSDVYALGATLYHLLARKEPWRLLEDPGAIERLNVSPGFRRFLAMVTARPPEERFQSAAEAAEALRKLGARKFPNVSIHLPVRPSMVVGLALSLAMAAGFFLRANLGRPVSVDGGPPAAREGLDPPISAPLQALVRLTGDGQAVEVKRLDDLEFKRIEIIPRCGRPRVGLPRVRHAAVRGSAVEVTFGKHCHASISLDDLGLVCRGCD